ncbi:MAG: FliH/SctL family protein [Solirubrobacteraceae bacterium]|jgi:flagellar assembly protein FliH
MAMTSSDAAAASEYSFEQLQADALVRSRLSGVTLNLADPLPDGGERDRENARSAAIAEGRAAGLAQAREQAAPAIHAIGEALTGIQALRDEVATRVERDAVELALAVAEQIVGAAVEVSPERVVEVVRGALRRLADRHRVTILVNPDDVELVSEQLDALRSDLGGIDHGVVQADRRVVRGGAIVQTIEGAIDAQVESQLERARSVVAAELAGQ